MFTSSGGTVAQKISWKNNVNCQEYALSKNMKVVGENKLEAQK